jgi:hypothetical protein
MLLDIKWTSVVQDVVTLKLGPVGQRTKRKVSASLDMMLMCPPDRHR